MPDLKETLAHLQKPEWLPRQVSTPDMLSTQDQEGQTLFRNMSAAEVANSLERLTRLPKAELLKFLESIDLQKGLLTNNALEAQQACQA